MKIANNILELIGNTPLIKIKNEVSENIVGKVEAFNPGGSVKDRVARNMIFKAIEEGKINKDTVIIEPTSGNTGIGLAMVGSALGYRVILVMPESMSVERRNLLKGYGGELVLTEAKFGMQGTLDKAKELAKEIENSFIPSQFDNKNNNLAHYETTGKEIWEDTDGKIDIFVAGIGTGGTVSGVGKYLKEKNPNIKIIGVEPFESPLISSGVFGPHKIQGIGANFIPKNLDKDILDEVVVIKGEQAVAASKELATKQGLLVGISSGASYLAALELAKREENKDKLIVALMPDSGERYLMV